MRDATYLDFTINLDPKNNMNLTINRTQPTFVIHDADSID